MTNAIRGQSGLVPLHITAWKKKRIKPGPLKAGSKCFDHITVTTLNKAKCLLSDAIPSPPSLLHQAKQPVCFPSTSWPSVQPISKTHCLRRGSWQRWMMQSCERNGALAAPTAPRPAELRVPGSGTRTLGLGTLCRWLCVCSAEGRGKLHGVFPTALRYARGEIRAQRHLQPRGCCLPDAPRLMSRAGQIPLTTGDGGTFPVWRISDGSGCGGSTTSIGWVTIPSLAAQVNSTLFWRHLGQPTTVEILQTSHFFNRNAERKRTTWVLSELKHANNKIIRNS